MIFSTAYFPPISFWILWKQQGSIRIEAHENYQKRSFRNRMHIATHMGYLPLSIPLLKGKNSRMPIQEVTIDNTQPWQRDHRRSLQTSYGKSPFFEHYIAELNPLFETKFTSLFEFNLRALSLVADLLSFDNECFTLTEKYERLPDEVDFRSKIMPNQDLKLSFVNYVQVFQSETGFIPNLSVLDLLFCMGPEAQRFL